MLSSRKTIVDQNCLLPNWEAGSRTLSALPLALSLTQARPSKTVAKAALLQPAAGVSRAVSCAGMTAGGRAGQGRGLTCPWPRFHAHCGLLDALRTCQGAAAPTPLWCAGWPWCPADVSVSFRRCIASAQAGQQSAARPHLCGVPLVPVVLVIVLQHPNVRPIMPAAEVHQAGPAAGQALHQRSLLEGGASAAAHHSGARCLELRLVLGQDGLNLARPGRLLGLYLLGREGADGAPGQRWVHAVCQLLGRQFQLLWQPVLLLLVVSGQRGMCLRQRLIHEPGLPRAAGARRLLPCAGHCRGLRERLHRQLACPRVGSWLPVWRCCRLPARTGLSWRRWAHGPSGRGCRLLWCRRGLPDCTGCRCGLRGRLPGHKGRGHRPCGQPDRAGPGCRRWGRGRLDCAGHGHCRRSRLRLPDGACSPFGRRQGVGRLSRGLRLPARGSLAGSLCRVQGSRPHTELPAAAGEDAPGRAAELGALVEPGVRGARHLQRTRVLRSTGLLLLLRLLHRNAGRLVLQTRCSQLCSVLHGPALRAGTGSP